MDGLNLMYLLTLTIHVTQREITKGLFRHAFLQQANSILNGKICIYRKLVETFHNVSERKTAVYFS